MPEFSPLKTSAFALPESLARKNDPTLIGGDEQHFQAIETSLTESIADLSGRLDHARKQPGGRGQAALDRDQEIHRITARLRALRRFGLDLCLGRMVTEESPEPVYVGRLGLTDSKGRRLLIDWRSPAAEPFFGATHANPMGLVSRRRYRWTRGRISDYWDEVFTAEGLESNAALDDQSAFIATLGSSRSPRMRDVLGTIQADQDQIIRAGSRGAMVVDGGPGTGKTVVALHRTAYLLYSDPRLNHRGSHRSDVLLVGPHQPYLAYVADVLPSLGEEGVQTCTLKDLVPEGATAVVESNPDVARLKSSVEMVKAIESAVKFYEAPPSDGLDVETPYADVWLSSEDWAEAFDAPDPGTPHNEAREEVWDALLGILVDKLDDAPESLVRRALTHNPELRAAFAKAWPLLDYSALVADLWRVPAYLRLCAPWLQPGEVATLQRDNPEEWTTADLPLLDAARQRLGDPEAARRRRKQKATLAAERELMDRVVEDLIAADDSENLEMYMLRGEDMRDKLVDVDALESADPDVLAGPFAHIVVDEAQELTDAQWRMLLLRCPSRSFTVVGDRAQARHGFAESWEERLERVGLGAAKVSSLNINYRTPEEVMAEAEPVIRQALPDANVPTSVRRSGIPVVHGETSELAGILDGWQESNPEGIACVISRPDAIATTDAARTDAVRTNVAKTNQDRVSWLTPELAKGLEFDIVVLLDPESFGEGIEGIEGVQGIEGAVDRYVAMTRATRELVILRSGR